MTPAHTDSGSPAPGFSPALILLLRGLQLAVGLLLYGFGIALLLRANLGATPWDVLGQGLSLQTGLSFGTVIILISAVILVLWIPLKQRPGWGTAANAVLVGIFADVSLALLPEFTTLEWQIPVLCAGIAAIGVATGLYIGVNLGPGPRDGLMTGLHTQTGLALWIVRTGLEVTVLIIGWLLGGTVGVGTAAFALLIGPIVNFTIPLFSFSIYRGNRNTDNNRTTAD